jgi:hypothetical protein
MKAHGMALQITIACMLIMLAIVSRLLPHPANFAPVMAVAIFGGAVLPRHLALWVPLIAIAVSDMIIGFYPIMLIVWSCYLVVAFVSNKLLTRPTFVKGAAVTIGASVFFFLITNFAVWLLDNMYVHSFSGLAQCYLLALPFFHNSFLSDLLYTTSLFTMYTFVVVLVYRTKSILQRA